jgi:DNA-directed RNA polymerase specialized sigma24 family protein
MNEQRSPNSGVSFDTWLETERALIYDYMVRMMGDLSRAQSSTFEVMQACRQMDWRHSNMSKMRIQLFRTARSFNADRWFRCPTPLLDHIYLGTNRQQDLRALEEMLESLPQLDREILLLRYRYGFLSEEIADLLGKPVAFIQESINRSVLQLRSQQSDLDTKTFQQLPLFPLIEMETTTLAIEDVVDKISKPWHINFWKITFWLIVFIGGGWLVNRQWPWLWADALVELKNMLPPEAATWLSQQLSSF